LSSKALPVLLGAGQRNDEGCFCLSPKCIQGKVVGDFAQDKDSPKTTSKSSQSEQMDFTLSTMASSNDTLGSTVRETPARLALEAFRLRRRQKEASRGQPFQV
ncbi:unnamed protein product, partial [Polarella glacialis]